MTEREDVIELCLFISFRHSRTFVPTIVQVVVPGRIDTSCSGSKIEAANDEFIPSKRGK